MNSRLAHVHLRAFTLVEVTLALGVAAVGFLAIFGLLPVGINTSQAAIEQTAAAGILSAVAADLRSTPQSASTALTTPEFRINIPLNPVAASAPVSRAYVTLDGQYEAFGGAFPADAHFLLTVTFVPTATFAPGSPARAPTLAQLRISWPAAAGLSRSIGSLQQLVVLDRN